jgi:spore cortex formation protein SpoVR/YcgB (stage V sporulation)
VDRTSSYLDRRYAKETLAYVAELWQHPVHVLTCNEQGHDVDLTAAP